MSNLSKTVLSAVGLAATLALVPAAAGAAPKSDTTRVMIAFKPGTAAASAVRAAIAKAGGRVVVELDEVNAVAVELPRRAVAALKRHTHVDVLEEDGLRYAIGTAPAKRTKGKTSANTVVMDPQMLPYGVPMVQADQVSDDMAGNRKLCIVDSGYDLAHEDLSANPVDGVNLTSSGLWSTDENDHGTHVAGTIAALNNSVGVIGVAPNAKLKLYISKVLDASGSATTSTVIKGMLSCLKAGSNVVSMSLGGSGASKIEQRVVSLMAARNVLLIAAAGNDGDSSVSYPAGFAEVMSVAAVDSSSAHASFSQFNSDVEIAGPGVAVMSTVPMGHGITASASVGGTAYPVIGMTGSPTGTATAELVNFGLGETTNPAAAGKTCLIQRGNISFADKVLNCQNSGGVGAIIYNNVSGDLVGTLGTTVTTIPSVGANGDDGAALVAQVGQSATVTVTTTNYASFNGTSMATPHVSAVAALVWSRFPACSAAQIRSSLNKSAIDLGDAGRDVYYGYGLVQAKAAVDRIQSMGCGN